MLEKIEKLERDIIFFDLETTGTDIKTEDIVEICAIKKDTEGNKHVYKKRFKTDIEISQEVIDVHGITNDDLKDENYFSFYAEEVYNFFKNCDLAGYNCRNFDIPMLFEKLSKEGFNLNIFKINVIDSYEIYNAYEKRDLNSLYKRFFDEDIENIHSSEADIIATERVFGKQIELYDLPKNISDISKEVLNRSNKEYIDFSRWFYKKDDKIYYNKGKYRNMEVKSQMSYLSWLVNDSGIEKNAKVVAKLLYDKYIKKVEFE